MTNIDILKQKAAHHAVTFIESGMVIGLGHGSTAIHAVRRIGERIQTGELKDVVGIPASDEIEAEALKLGIPLTTFADHPSIDITIDGADEVDPHLNIIKGGGGALLREKVIAQASKREIIIVDERKITPALGTRFRLPVEVLQFGWESQTHLLESLGAKWELRLNADKTPFITDQRNFILDCNFGEMTDPYAIANRLNALAMVVDHGLFLDIATDVIVASESGIQHLKR